MTNVPHTDFAAALDALIATIPARSPEFEQARRIPLDVVASMREAGVFKMFLPKAYGGLELGLPAIIDAIRKLSRADASIGWTAMIGAGSALFATMLPREAFDRLYADDSNTIMAGSTQALGVIDSRAEGLHVQGQWPFASGCLHADWMLGFCQATPGNSATAQQPHVVVLPAARWAIIDTWHVPGLRGTGSADIALETYIDPETDIFDVSALRSWMPGPLYAGVPQMIALMHGAVSLGIAEGALNDLLDIALSGRRQERATAVMRDTEAYQRDLGQVHADVRAARSVLDAQTTSHWQQAQDGMLATDAKLVEGSQSAIWVVTTCRKAVDLCFALGGSVAIYDESPLQRRMRDIHVAAQHNLMQPRHYQKAGKLLIDRSESFLLKSQSP